MIASVETPAAALAAAGASKTRTVLFITGAWMHTSSWDKFRSAFDAAGFKTLAPAWPFERSVEDADAHPASPLPVRVVDLRVKAGDRVEKGEVLAVVEGMKMQHAIRAGRAGRILQVLARQGELVDAEAILFDIGPA